MPTGPDPDTIRLRTALRDIVALSTFPAAWVGREPSAIAAGLADLLVGSLYLDFAFVRLCDPKGGATVEATRGDAWRSFPEWLQNHLTVMGHTSLREVIPHVDLGGRAEPCRGIVIPIGVDSEGGLVAAASGRANFPDEIDRLLLSVAANQAATACESARLLNERRRAEQALRDARNELERKVEERTAELRRTTADLLEREAKIRRLVDANIIGIIFWNLDGQILDANDAFLKMVGYDREDLLAARIRWSDLTPPEFRDRNAQAIEELKRTGTTLPSEKEYFRKDGSRVPVLMGRATFEDGGNQGVAFVLDLTERKRAEEALRASEERFRDYAEVASDWFWETGPDHRFTEFSRTAADWELPADLVGKTRWDLAADREKEPEKWHAHISTLEAHQPFRGFRYKIPHPDGSARYVSVSGKPVFDGSGAFLGYRGVATDVSAEVRAEKALRESEERFRTLMQFSFDVYWETDAQHRFIRQDFSERVTDGPLPGSELGKRRWEVPYLDIDEEAWRKHREMLDAHLPFRDLEYGRPTPNGGKRYAAVSGLPMFDEAGRFIGYRGVGRHITERKQMEEALRQREKELREILETIPAMTVTVLPDGSDVFIGARFSEYSGLSLEDARGSGWRATIHPDDLDRHVRTWRASLASGEPIEIETRFRRRDGEYRWFLARAVPLRDEKGNILNWYEVLTDIEDRKRAEQALRRSEAYLTEAQRLSHTGSFAYHPSSRKTLFWSEELFRIFQLDPRRGIPDYDETRRLVHPDDLETVSATCLQGFRDKAEFSQTYRLLLRDGTVKHLHAVWHPIVDETGEVAEYVGTAADVTEREQAEQNRKRGEAALRESEEQWKAVFENNPVMYFMVGETGTIISVNPFGAEQLGYTVDELIGHPVTIVFYEPDREVVQKNAAACFERPGQAVSWELRKHRKNGEVIWVRETARATVINDRPVLLIVCEDISEGKHAAEALREAQMELAHANRLATMGQLTASIAHEISQPVATARHNASAALNFLARTPPDLGEVREALRGVVSDTDRARDIIGRIRSHIRKAPLRKDSFDLNEAIREVIALARTEVAKTGVLVQNRFTEGLSPVQADRVQVQQIVLNLILNAIEAMSSVDEGSRELLISTEQCQTGGVLVAVHDSGPGIDPGHLERVFEAFYTTKSTGVGMGLSICRSIIDAHGGRLWAEANKPKGAVFRFTLPAESSDL